MGYRNQWKTGPRPVNKYKPYKNQFEYKIAQSMPDADYEDKSRVVVYQTENKYNVDFTFKHIPWLLIEAKGRFMGGSKEAAKYVWVKRCHSELELLFIFSNTNNKAYPGCRKRKDGTFLTMGEWAAKNNFVSFSSKHLPPWLVDGEATKKLFREVLNKQREMYGLKQLSPYIWGDK